MAEYSETLGILLMENEFIHSNVLDICYEGFLLWIVPQNIDTVDLAIEDFRKNHINGCIFSLPSDMASVQTYVYYSPQSEDEIRRAIKLKAFL